MYLGGLFQHRMMMMHVNNQAQHLKEKIHIHSCAFCPLNTLHAKLANQCCLNGITSTKYQVKVIMSNSWWVIFLFATQRSIFPLADVYHQKEEMLFYSLFGVNSKIYSVVSPGCRSISSSQNPEVDLLSHVKRKKKRCDVWFMRAMQEKHFIIMLYWPNIVL